MNFGGSRFTSLFASRRDHFLDFIIDIFDGRFQPLHMFGVGIGGMEGKIFFSHFCLKVVLFRGMVISFPVFFCDLNLGTWSSI